MGFAAVRAALKTLLEGVEGIGEVHDYRRHTTTWEKYFQRHAKNGRVNNWEITREAAEQELIAVQGAGGTEPWYHNTHRVAILGFMGLDDAKPSEKDFQDLVDAVVEKIRKNPRLGNVVLLPESLQVPAIGHAMFGGVLVHTARLTFRAVERVGG